MKSHEFLTPRDAAHESAANLKALHLAAKAIDHAQIVIEQSKQNAADPQLDDHRRSIGAYHAQFWTERQLPERRMDYERADLKATRDYRKNQGAYYTAALAEAMLDGITIETTDD